MTTIKHRRGNSADWDVANPVLAAGELGVELNTGRVKVGNGLTPWSQLDYFASESDLHLGGLYDVSAPADTPVGKVLGTVAIGQWGPVDAGIARPVGPGVVISPTEPAGTDHTPGTLWVVPEGTSGVVRGAWNGTAWSTVGAFPTDITYDADPGRPEFIIRNNYPHAVGGRDTLQVWANGELTHWWNEWGGPRIRVPATSSWDSALRIIAAAQQTGNLLEVEDSTRTKYLLVVRSNGIIEAPNIKQPVLVLYGSENVPSGTPTPALIARVGATTARWNFFDNASAGDASLTDGWDGIFGTAPVYGSQYAWRTMGLYCQISANAMSYVYQKISGANSGYARMRVRVPALGNRNPRVFQTESTAGGVRHGVRINSSGKVEIVSFDGFTVLATSTMTVPINAWFDLSIRWVPGTSGSCTVRIHTTPESEAIAETVTATGDFLGAGGTIAGVRWGLHATSAGTNTLHIGMVAWDTADWVVFEPPPQTAGELFVWDGSAEIPMGSPSGGGGGITQAQADARYLQLAGGTVTGNVNISGWVTIDNGNLTVNADVIGDLGSFRYGVDAYHNKVVRVGLPTVSTDAANKGYVDSRIWKGTQSEYDAIAVKDPTVLYVVI